MNVFRRARPNMLSETPPAPKGRSIEYDRSNQPLFDRRRDYVGIITRISDRGFGYLVEQETREPHGFTFSQIRDYAGESADQLGLHEGARVVFRPAANGTVEYIKLIDPTRLRIHSFHSTKLG